eukprot:5423034-Pleurochrysis_carterae.AAC.1
MRPRLEWQGSMGWRASTHKKDSYLLTQSHECYLPIQGKLVAVLCALFLAVAGVRGAQRTVELFNEVHGHDDAYPDVRETRTTARVQLSLLRAASFTALWLAWATWLRMCGESGD